MERFYNIRFLRKRRTSLIVEPVDSCLVYAVNKQSARELAEAILRDMGKNEYMIKQYKIVIEREEE